MTGPGQLNLNGGTATTSTTANLPTTSFNTGTLAGGGTFTVPSGTTATIPPGSFVTLNGGTTLRNEGTVNNSNNGYITYGYTGDNKATNAGTWNFTTTSDPLFNPSGNPASAFTNAGTGTVNVSLALAGDTMSLGYLPITNNGTLNVTKGHLATTVGGAGTGTYQLASGTSLDLNNGTLPLTGTQLTGPGQLNLNGGTATTSTTANLPTTSFNTGTLAGGGTFTVPSGTTATIPPAASSPSTAAPPSATKAPSTTATTATSPTATPATTRPPTPAPGR